MKKFKLIFSTILCLIFFGITHSPTWAANLTVNFETTPLFQVSDGPWMPGDSLTRQAVVTNTSGTDQLIKVEAFDKIDPSDLSQKFNFWVYDFSTTHFFGTLKEFLGYGELPLIVQGAAPHTYYFAAQFPTSVGNEWQGKEVTFDLRLGFDGSTPPPNGGPDGHHLVCHSNNQCVLEVPEGNDEDPCSGKFSGSYCVFTGTGEISGTPSPTPPPPPGPAVAGATTTVLGAGATKPETLKEELKEAVEGVATEEVGETAGAVAECCCLWWVFILIQIIAHAVYLIKNKGRNVTYGRLATVWIIFGIGSFILYALLCNWLQDIIGCVWPSGIIPAICNWHWYLLIDLFVLILAGIPYFLARSGRGKSILKTPAS